MSMLGATIRSQVPLHSDTLENALSLQSFFITDYHGAAFDVRL
jgi:hypothetical protein